MLQRGEKLLCFSWNILNIPSARELIISKLFLHVTLHLKILSLGKRLPIKRYPNLRLYKILIYFLFSNIYDKASTKN